MHKLPRKSRLITAAVAVTATTLLLAGCSPAASNGGGSTSAASGSSATNLDDFTAEAQALVDQVTALQTVTPPATGPAKVAEAKKIFIIACSMAAEGCSRPADAIAQAADAIGWESTINDPGGDPSKMANAVAQAVSSGYDAIALTAIDAQTIQSALQQAKDAGLLIAANASVDTESNPLFDFTVPDAGDFFDQGYATGAKMFLDQGSDMKVAMLTGTEFGTVRERLEGTKQFIADCVAAGGSCSVVDEQNFLVTDLTGSLPGQAAAMVRAKPDANALWIGYDAGANFAIQGLEAAGLDTPVYSFDGNVANITRIASDKIQKSTAATAMEWSGFGIIDNFNRIWAGEEPVDQGPTFKLLTADNVTSGAAWDGDIEVQADYEKIWNGQ